MNLHRKYWIAIGGAVAVALVAGLAIALKRKSPAPSPFSPTQSLSTPSPPPRQSPPLPDAQSALDPTFLVLASMGSTPEGARIVRVSDGFVLGYTPETLEFHQSSQTVTVRFEMEGYTPVMREVSLVSDTELRIALKPAPAKRTHPARSPKN